MLTVVFLSVSATLLASVLCYRSGEVVPIVFAPPSLGGCEYCGAEFRPSGPQMPSSAAEGLCAGCADDCYEPDADKPKLGQLDARFPRR